MTDDRRMGLGALTDAVAPERVVGIPVGEVRALAYDSRKVTSGTVFFAVPGDHVDGHDFVRAAVEGGAIAAVVERELPDVTAPQLVVDRSRRALADAAQAWFDRPRDHLRRAIGVTGTDGKSTVTALTAEVLRDCGWHPGQIGTVFTGIGDDREPNLERTTTPEALEIQELLARMVAAGNDSVVMEATSHGLALERTRNVRFDIGVVTTVTSEHLEFHGTVEAYRAAKAKLVEEAPIAVLNADDAAFGYFRDRARDRVITYAIDTDADLRAADLEADAAGTTFRVTSPRWHGRARIGLPGRFNVSNALASLAVAEAMELDLERAADALSRTGGVPGRMERVDAGQPFTVIVDYAHTTDALRKVLDILRPLTTGRLIAVFGSAGERDATKRAPMGRVAAELSDLVVVTDEDPRLEDPRVINEEIADGARSVGAADGETLWVVDDRREAIGHAIGLAKAGDVILLAGKGHEQSIIVGTQQRPWDDRAAAREALAAAGWGTDDAR
ncbi:MAG TPA: UDP-N-acetylmuramoyl-L-alanyl-D-glutamate--2,6-diaminopimelate ligase [Candidatus Limnocylindrales bacterium]|nr:UDP-N-acetylmuramoyl-L-alanyl-D-glutamate--2,6-diaminopimelate ligase [Candidatus Limnocylindrales bacterium]